MSHATARLYQSARVVWALLRALANPCLWHLLVFSESDSDLEPVGAGIQHLQKLSQKLDKAIKAEER